MPVPSIPGFQAVSQSCLTLISYLNPFTSRFNLNWRDSGITARVVSIANRAIGALFDRSSIACGVFVALGALSLYNGYRVHHFKEKNQQSEKDKRLDQLLASILEKGGIDSYLEKSKKMSDDLEKALKSLSEVKGKLESKIEELKQSNVDIESLKEQNQELQGNLSVAQSRIAELEGQLDELQKIKLEQSGDESKNTSTMKEKALVDQSDELSPTLLCESDVKLQQNNQDPKQEILPEEQESYFKSEEMKKLEQKWSDTTLGLQSISHLGKNPT